MSRALFVALALLSLTPWSARAEPEAAALFPFSGDEPESQLRLLDAAVRRELERAGLALLSEEDRRVHAQGARSLGLGCEVESSPACAYYVAAVANLRWAVLGTTQKGRVKLELYEAAGDKPTRRATSEAALPPPGEPLVPVARALVSELLPGKAPPTGESTSGQSTSSQGTSGQGTSSQGTSGQGNSTAQGDTSSQGNGNTSSHMLETPVQQPPPATENPWLVPAIGVASVGSALVVGGGVSLGVAYLTAATPFQGQPDKKAIEEREGLVGATTWLGAGLCAAGVVALGAGAGLGWLGALPSEEAPAPSLEEAPAPSE